MTIELMFDPTDDVLQLPDQVVGVGVLLEIINNFKGSMRGGASPRSGDRSQRLIIQLHRGQHRILIHHGDGSTLGERNKIAR